MSLRATLAAAALLALGWWLLVAVESSETNDSLDSAWQAERLHTPLSAPTAEASSSGTQRRDPSFGGDAASDELIGALRVLCLAADGAPLSGLAVELRALDASGERPLVAELRATSDAEGRLLFAGARERLRGKEAPHGWVLTNDAFRPWVAPLRLDLERDFERVVEWRLPPFGAVEVRVLDPSGADVPDGTIVAIEEALEAKTRALSQETAGGKVRFEHLGLSTPFVLRVFLGLGSGEHLARVEPLGDHGELRRVELRLGAGQTWLAARLFAADGARLSAERLTVELCTAQRDTRDVGGRTSSTGALLVWLEPFGDDLPHQLLLRRPEQAQSLLVELPEIVRGATLDLGDLTLREDELIASGVVRDRAGDGVAGATVEAWPLDPSAPSERHPLRSVAPRSAISSDGGRFEIREPDLRDRAPQRYRLGLRLRSAPLTAVPVEVSRGATEVELRVVASGSLHAQLVLPEGMPIDRLRFELAHETGSIHPAACDRRNGEPWLYADDLPPGSYVLQLRVPTYRDPLPLLSGVSVPSGAVCPDPRLRPLDLRPHVQVIALEIEVAESARDVGAATLELRERSAPPEAVVRMRMPVNAAPFSLVLPTRALVGVLHHAGCEPVELDLSLPRQRVTLRPR